MAETSAGIVLFRRSGGGIQVLLAHPGGPYWSRRDLGAWTIPKGLLCEGEAPQDAARREFAEEMGSPVEGSLHPLGRVRLRSGKSVEGYAVEGEFDTAGLHSNLFELEWPPRSGRVRTFPEIDRAQWFGLDQARQHLLPAQVPLLDRLESWLDQAG